ncbi:MAG: Rossmann-like domain-containing protein [Chloroflexota bacterium]
MPVIDDLITYAQHACTDQPVRDVRVGLHWTAVLGERLGLAATQADESCCFAGDIQNAGSLHEMSQLGLIDYLRSSRPLEAGVGMAALNGCLPLDEQRQVELNARDLIVSRGRGRNVALVGHFAFTEAVRSAAGQLWVLELDPTAGDLPAERAPDLLPQADVIGITAVTLLNRTFDNLAGLFPPHALVVMLGPTTPLCPVLFDYGVDVLSGAVVTDAPHVLRLISQCSPLHGPAGLKRMTLARAGKPGEIA